MIDDFFDPEMVEKMLAEFPGRKDIDWIDNYHPYQDMLVNRNLDIMGVYTKQAINALHSRTFVNFLEELVGIQNLLPDPDITGGGQHNTFKGGRLEVHIDYNKHRMKNWDRRVNLILYFNKEWKDEYEGLLELWDSNMQKCVKKFPPIFNRMVIFNCSKISFHGYPQPLNCPKDRSRKSLALYYYTEENNYQNFTPSHNTLFQTRPGEKKVPLYKIKVLSLLDRIFKKLKQILKK